MFHTFQSAGSVSCFIHLQALSMNTKNLHLILDFAVKILLIFNLRYTRTNLLASVNHHNFSILVLLTSIAFSWDHSFINYSVSSKFFKSFRLLVEHSLLDHFRCSGMMGWKRVSDQWSLTTFAYLTIALSLEWMNMSIISIFSIKSKFTYMRTQV